MSSKQTNRDAFCMLIPKIWRTNQEVEVEIVHENIFAFHFQTALDRNRVLTGGPWNFDGSLLAIEEPRGWGDFSKMLFRWMDFWVQIHNVPLLCMTKDIASFLGEKIGKVKELDLGVSGDCIGKFIRIRVQIDTLKPLKRGLRLQLEGNREEITTLLRYERLPEYCFCCGMIDYHFRVCTKAINESSSVVVTDYAYGSWLRASNPTRGRGRVAKRENDYVGEVLVDQQIQPALDPSHTVDVPPPPSTSGQNNAVEHVNVVDHVIDRHRDKGKTKIRVITDSRSEIVAEECFHQKSMVGQDQSMYGEPIFKFKSQTKTPMSSTKLTSVSSSNNFLFDSMQTPLQVSNEKVTISNELAKYAAKIFMESGLDVCKQKTKLGPALANTIISDGSSRKKTRWKRLARSSLSDTTMEDNPSRYKRNLKSDIVLE
ncbi:hypothetical protein JRO89_XS05G0083100 [Xanthoceras sorbifolium]|uniref:DUF4283 domain-containing protein n=1 Tax=Xanthoceras sorbifolium TaxID=99658 RepID=A0ABQ8I123_9ROSI|nr:hypothetical protein JRO89_XS05G0083100 [Xanthoceras sorbifolium]